LSCTEAAVTSTAQQRPSASVATCRFRPLIFLALSTPWVASGGLHELFTDWASKIAAGGSAERPARSRAFARSRPWIAWVVPSFSRAA
jgi:hypothetical protein